ncbi:MAG: hypothetical protein LBL79_09315 [Prevotella sp.]|nr:hypothetical protein [Prevotella sp.]
MKKLTLIIFSIMLILTGCGTLQMADVTRLSSGMTQPEVNRILGNPVRILSSSYTQDGELDVYEYITYRNESYAVEFLNGWLNRYDFMYENTPPATIAPNPAPVYPVRPTSPVKPQPTKPASPVRPQQEKPATRPTETNKPAATRPTTPPSGTTTTGRPATRPSGTTSTGRPATKTATTESSTTKTNSEEKKTNEPSK